jgi:hypothetical protein
VALGTKDKEIAELKEALAAKNREMASSKEKLQSTVQALQELLLEVGEMTVALGVKDEEITKMKEDFHQQKITLEYKEELIDAQSEIEDLKARLEKEIALRPLYVRGAQLDKQNYGSKCAERKWERERGEKRHT